MTMTPATAHVRKIHKAGRSRAVIIPPDCLAHIHASEDNYLYFDTSAPDFLIVSVAPVPPQYTHPELFPPPGGPPADTKAPATEHQSEDDIPPDCP